MALDRTKLEKLAGGLRQRFAYSTADAIGTVTGSGYFNDVTNQLRQYDVIEVVSETGGTPKIDLVFVTSATGAATVTTSGTEGITAT